MSALSILTSVVFAVMLIVHMKRYLENTEKAKVAYAHMGASDIAARLGLDVTAGDGALNVMMLHHDHITADAELTKKGGFFEDDVHHKRHGVTLSGRPQGRAQSFDYWLDTVVESAGTLHRRSRWTRTLTFALATAVRAPFPDFEVVLRHPNGLLAPKRVTSLPAQGTGVPAVDAAFVVYTNDARVAVLIGPLLVGLASHTFVHVVGRAQRLELLSGHEHSSYASYYLEENARLHHAIADAIERFAAG